MNLYLRFSFGYVSIVQKKEITFYPLKFELTCNFMLQDRLIFLNCL